MAAEVWDIDGDGHEEIWVHSDRFSAIVSPWRGGALEEYTLFSTATNYANTLTRRREAYHDTAMEQRAETGSHEGGTPSIHDIEEGIHLDQRPPIDADDRALFVDRVISSTLQREQYAAGDYQPVKSWARCRYIGDVGHEPDAVEIRMNGEGLAKQYRFLPDGSITVSYTWEESVGQPSDFFTTELSLFAPLPLVTDPQADIWTFPIETVAKSERGLDRTRQGESVTLRWPVETGTATIELPATQTQSMEPAIAAKTADLA